MAEQRDFESALAYGQEGEREVARWLMERSVKVSPLYQFQGHDRAPVLLRHVDGREVASIMPDLTCWKSGRCFFAEVKRKSRWVGPFPSVPSLAARGAETGFNLRHWRQYLDVARETDCSVYVFFLHEQRPPVGLYLGEVSALAPHVREWDGRHWRTGARIESPLALFPGRCLKRIADLGDVVAEAA